MPQQILVDLQLKDSGSMKAVAEVSIPTEMGPVTISGFKVVETGGNPWVSPPSKEFSNKAGERKFQKLMDMPKPLQRAVQEAVLVEYRKKSGKQ